MEYGEYFEGALTWWSLRKMRRCGAEVRRCLTKNIKCVIL